MYGQQHPAAACPDSTAVHKSLVGFLVLLVVIVALEGDSVMGGLRNTDEPLSELTAREYPAACGVQPRCYVVSWPATRSKQGDC